MGQYRMEKLGDQLRDEIAKLIMHGDVKDPRVSTFLTVNRVEVSKDLSFAKAYVSSFLPEGQLKRGVEGLNNAAGFIQSSIAKKLRIRQFPKITFYVDTAMKDGFDMVRRLTELEKSEQAEQAEMAMKETGDSSTAIAPSE